MLAVAVAAGLAVAAPAGARTYFVSGLQLPGEGGTATMVGGLLGTWTFNDDFVLNPAIQPPLFTGLGTERFDGCLNRHRDRSCRHDPKGSMTFYNDTWVRYAGTADAPVLVWGACVHPVTSGSGAFAGAQGVLTMIDTPTPRGPVVTRYDGNIILAEQSGAAAPPQALSGPPAQSAAAPLAQSAAAPRRGCGSA